MNNNLNALNNALFEQIERLQNDDLTAEELQKEINRSQAVSKVAEIIVHNGELALKTMEHLNEYGYGRIRNDNELAPVPQMLVAKNE